MPLRTESLSRVRMAGRMPRLAFVSVAVVLSVLGLRALVVPAAERVGAHALRAAPVDPALEGFAESFARWYYSRRAEDNERSQRDFGLSTDGLVDDHSARDARRLQWSAVVGSTRRSRGEALVTVALDDGRATTYLAVTAARDARGRLFVSRPPAIVGPPSVASGRVPAPEVEVEDSNLRTVAARVLRHYLAGEAVDLDADLIPGAAVSLPSTPLRLADVVATTWVVLPRRVAVSILARSRAGQQLTLRYELDVVRHGRRWLVRRVHVNPMALEAQR